MSTEVLRAADQPEPTAPAVPPTLMQAADQEPNGAAGTGPAPSTVNTTLLGGPQRVGDYELLEVLGRGGMGVVYKARDLKLKRYVALKMLRVGADVSPLELSRFRAEAEAVAQLQHPNVVQIYDIGQHQGQPYLVFEFVDNGSLDRHTQGQPRPPRWAAECVETLARAVHHAHQKGIIHRDLKPANVLLTRSGTFKLTDFGLAKLLDTAGDTKSGDVLGTPSYMAPEQAAGKKDITVAVDTYALGALLYELLTGRPPFRGVSVLDTLEQVREADPAPPSRLVPKLHRDLSTVCLKCLYKSPHRRYGSAEALADDLRRWLDGMPISAAPPGAAERLWHGVRRRPLATALGVTSAVLVVSLTLLALVLWDQATKDHLNAQLAAKQATINQQHRESMATLGGILNLVTEGDLRNQPGLEKLHGQLLEFFTARVRQQESDPVGNADELARACDRLGELMAKTGNKADALEAFEKARRLYEGLADGEAGEEGKAAVRHVLGRIRLKKGSLHSELGDRKEAEEEYRAALELLEPLAGEDARRRRDLAEVWHNLGDLHSGTKATWDQALVEFNKALKIRQALSKDEPKNLDYQRDLARSHGYLGDLQLDLGLLSKADASYAASHKIRLRLAGKDEDEEAGARPPAKEEKPSPESLFQLARSYNNFGNYHTRGRAHHAAYGWRLAALRLQKALVAEHPAVTEYLDDLAQNYVRLADLLLLQSAEAEAADRGALKKDALGMLDKARETFKALDKRSGRQILTVRRGQAEVHLLRAQLLADDEDRGEATAALNAALALLKELQPLGSANDLYALAAAQALRGELIEDKGQSAGEAVKQLGQALAAGYRRKHLDDVWQERAFSKLQNNPDFRRLCGRTAPADSP